LDNPIINKNKFRKDKSTSLIISAIFFNQYQFTAAQIDLNYSDISDENLVKVIELSIEFSDECHEWYLNLCASAHFINKSDISKIIDKLIIK
jgi:hypothetical protein